MLCWKSTLSQKTENIESIGFPLIAPSIRLLTHAVDVELKRISRKKK